MTHWFLTAYTHHETQTGFLSVRFIFSGPQCKWCSTHGWCPWWCLLSNLSNISLLLWENITGCHNKCKAGLWLASSCEVMYKYVRWQIITISSLQNSIAGMENWNHIAQLSALVSCSLWSQYINLVDCASPSHPSQLGAISASRYNKSKNYKTLNCLTSNRNTTNTCN